MSEPLFPGGVAVSELRVYDWQASDGCFGGSPHLHTASSEAYLVRAGSGEVHTVTPAGRSAHPLAPGDIVWFSPGTVHRLVNGGELGITVIMQNAGLPEAGDAVLLFPNDVLDDPDAYERAATLPDDPDARADAALARRDLAVAGYTALLADIEARGAEDTMADLHARAVALVRPRVGRWRQLWNASAGADAARTRAQLDALAAGRTGLLAEAAVARAIPNPTARFGMCGRLDTWAWPASGG